MWDRTGAACRDFTWAGYTGRRCRSEACSVGSWRQCGGISTGPSASAIRQQTRKPVRRKRCRKRQPQRRTMIGRDERSAIDERGGDAPRLTFAGVQDCRDVAARQFAPEENGFENRVGSIGNRAGAHLTTGPRQDAVPQEIGLDEPLQEVHLVEADLQEEPRERRQRFLAQVSPVRRCRAGAASRSRRDDACMPPRCARARGRRTRRLPSPGSPAAWREISAAPRRPLPSRKG